MGNSQREIAPELSAAPIHHFYSEKAWIEGAAEEQLKLVSMLEGMRNVAAFPDLHPGKYGPVGCAMLSDRIYPHLIGNDIGCGMTLFALDLPARKLRLDKAAEKLRSLEGPWGGDAVSRLALEGLPVDLMPEALGTIGGGNHFCEVQAVDTVLDADALGDVNLRRGDLLLLVHSGSRSLGAAVFDDVAERFAGLDPEAAAGRAYLQSHDHAVAWARLNRILIAERAAKALGSGVELICDAPHNLVSRHPDGWCHRKGAAKADGALVPLAGSRDALSYVLKPRSGQSEALASLAHGSGRKYDRRSMIGRVGTTRSGRVNLARTSFGGLVICEDRQLLIEEAPQAYKDPAHVVKDLQVAGLADPVASLKPLLTFKKAVKDHVQSKEQIRQKGRKHRRGRYD